MSNILTKATDLGALLLEGLDLIASITSSSAVRTADDSLHAIIAVVQALERAQAGTVTPDAARAEMAALESAIEQHDAQADKDLADKFKPTT